MEELSIRQLIDVPRLQRIQDRFAAATGFAMITVDYRGVPVTTASGFTPFCSSMRADPKRRTQCFKCDAHGGLQSAIDGKPYFYTCHTGLVDFSVPIMLGEQYLGAMLCGQVRTSPSWPIEQVIPPDPSWQEDPRLVEMFRSLPEADPDRLRSLADALFEVASYLVEKAYVQIIQNALSESELAMVRQGETPPERPASVRHLHPHPASPVTPGTLHDIDPNPPASRVVPLTRLGRSTAKRAAEPEFDFTGLARAIDDQDLVQALVVVNEFLDAVFADSGRFVGRLRLSEIENSIVLFAQETSSQAGWDLHQRVVRHRSQRYSQLSRWDWQRYLEELMFALFDDIERQTPPQQRTMNDLLNHIERTVEQPMTLTEAARFVNLSPSHLSRQFKAQLGVKFVDYVTAKRIRRVKMMLTHTDLPVLKIASTLGFQPVNYLSRAFKKETGLTPTEFRRLSREVAATS